MTHKVVVNGKALDQCTCSTVQNTGTESTGNSEDGISVCVCPGANLETRRPGEGEIDRIEDLAGGRYPCLSIIGEFYVVIRGATEEV